VQEELRENYNPVGDPRFDTEREVESLRAMIRSVEERAQGNELAPALRRQALGKGADESMVEARELEGVVRRNRLRWERNRLVRAGMKRAQRLGWPNTYTFTKSLGESILARRGRICRLPSCGLPSSKAPRARPLPAGTKGSTLLVRCLICSARIFGSFPSNEKKCLDVIPVDMVCRGMTLIAAALVQRKNARMYQLAPQA